MGIDIQPGTIIWTIINFVTLLILLRIFAWKPIVKALKSRETAIQDALDRAETAKADAERITADNLASMKKMEEEAQRVMRESREQAERFQTETAQKAQADAQKLLSQAQADIERGKQQALNELRNEVANLAVGGAERILNESLSSNADRHKNIIDQYLKQTSETN